MGRNLGFQVRIVWAERRPSPFAGCEVLGEFLGFFGPRLFHIRWRLIPAKWDCVRVVHLSTWYLSPRDVLKTSHVHPSRTHLRSRVAFMAPSSLQLHIPLSLHSCSIIVLPRLPPSFSPIRLLFFTSDDVILVQTVAIAPWGQGHGSNILTDSPAFTPVSSSPFCTQSPQDGIFKPSLIVPFPCLTLLGSFPLSLCKAWPGIRSSMVWSLHAPCS